MDYGKNYNPIQWQDEIVDEGTGEVLVEGTLFDQENMNRMEAGIDLQNIANAYTITVARQARSNSLELDKWKNQRLQEGEVEITNSNDGDYFQSSDPVALVALPGYMQFDSPDYSVVTEIIEGDPALIGDVMIYDKTSNGFKIKYTGSADSAKIRYILANPDV
ncbi:hypothetical protein JCM16358_23280 [Halanaerocella petrolearia]